jgi:hypothetical protein
MDTDPPRGPEPAGSRREERIANSLELDDIDEATAHRLLAAAIRRLRSESEAQASGDPAAQPAEFQVGDARPEFRAGAPSGWIYLIDGEPVFVPDAPD